MILFNISAFNVVRGPSCSGASLQKMQMLPLVPLCVAAFISASATKLRGPAEQPISSVHGDTKALVQHAAVNKRVFCKEPTNPAALAAAKLVFQNASDQVKQGPTDFVKSGCLKTSSFEGQPSLSQPLRMTIDRCFTFCQTKKGMTYFSLAKGKECFCTALSPGEHVDSKSCDVPCDGNEAEICGGVAGYTSTYTMIDCTPPTAEELAAEAEKKKQETLESYSSFTGQTCGQESPSFIDGAETAVASSDDCKLMCANGRGAETCHGFTFQRDTEKCTFVQDVTDGPIKRESRMTCFFKQIR